MSPGRQCGPLLPGVYGRFLSCLGPCHVQPNLELENVHQDQNLYDLLSSLEASPLWKGLMLSGCNKTINPLIMPLPSSFGVTNQDGAVQGRIQVTVGIGMIPMNFFWRTIRIGKTSSMMLAHFWVPGVSSRGSVPISVNFNNFHVSVVLISMTSMSGSPVVRAPLQPLRNQNTLLRWSLQLQFVPQLGPFNRATKSNQSPDCHPSHGRETIGPFSTLRRRLFVKICWLWSDSIWV